MSRLFLLLTRNLATIRRTYATTSSDPFRRPLSFESRNDADSIKPTNHFRRPVDLPSLVPTRPARLDGFRIELVDDGLWPHSLCGRGGDAAPRAAAYPADRVPGSNSVPDGPPDMDEIEDLRARKKLFYKLDRDSKEFEEYNVDFPRHHRKKPSQRKGQENPSRTDLKKERKKPEKPPIRSYETAEQKGAAEKRARRTPTFNQLTGPYHLPFCLDIYVTKGSVRACVVHRVTSRVVAVAHSISKDLKFDVGSRKDAKACAAVGAVLAQRAVEDDIHNVVYTPRKGDRIEGKLEVVLRSIIDNGIDVKVKLKQRRPVKRTIR